MPGFATTVPDVVLGDLHLHGISVNAVDREGRMPAVFGPNTFAASLVFLELGKSRIRIAERNAANLPAGEGLPYSDDADASLPSIPLRLGDVDLTAAMDSGSDSPFLLPLALAKRLPLEAPPKLSGRVGSAAGEQDVYSAVLRGVARVGAVEFRNPTLEFIDRPGEVGDIGLPILRQVTVVLDPAGLRSWILPPG